MLLLLYNTMINPKYSIWILVVLGVVALLLWGYYAQIKIAEPVSSTEEVVTIASTSTPKTSTSTAPKKTQTSTAKPTTLSYEQLVNKYVNQRIQFDAACHANPASLNLRNGSDLMLDNRAPSANTVYVDDVKYALPGYGYKIITLSNKSLPYVVRVDCGSGKNNAEIRLQ